MFLKVLWQKVFDFYLCESSSRHIINYQCYYEILKVGDSATARAYNCVTK